jgi:hypothetical protein
MQAKLIQDEYEALTAIEAQACDLLTDAPQVDGGYDPFLDRLNADISAHSREAERRVRELIQWTRDHRVTCRIKLEMMQEHINAQVDA